MDPNSWKYKSFVNDLGSKKIPRSNLAMGINRTEILLYGGLNPTFVDALNLAPINIH